MLWLLCPRTETLFCSEHRVFGCGSVNTERGLASAVEMLTEWHQHFSFPYAAAQRISWLECRVLPLLKIHGVRGPSSARLAGDGTPSPKKHHIRQRPDRDG
jgi:hypothetical protein